MEGLVLEWQRSQHHQEEISGRGLGITRESPWKPKKVLPATKPSKPLFSKSSPANPLCRVCSQILPAFCQLSNSFPKLALINADIDECPETTQHIRYTPTFHFYREGERVD